MSGSLHMGWRHVLFANWPVDPTAIRSAVPASLDLDTFDGDAWLSIVPFTNVDVRPTWLPDGWGFRLPELNLRTYVTVDDSPGVYFFNLDAEGVLGVLGGRWFHRLPYYYARIDLHVDDGEVRFRARRRHPGARSVDFRATYSPTGDAAEAEPGSLDAFLVERYRYFTVGRRGNIRMAAVDHEPWSLQAADVSMEPNTLFNANGLDPPDSTPVLRYSGGVDTIATANRRLGVGDPAASGPDC